MPIERDWKAYLQEGQRDTIKGILDFGKRIYEFKQSCQVVSGGSTFSRDIKEWLSMSQSIAERWVAIGKNSSKLINLINKLPSSYSIIYLLTTVPDDKLDELNINPNLTQKEVIDFKNRLKHDSQPKKKKRTSTVEESSEEFTAEELRKMAKDYKEVMEENIDEWHRKKQEQKSSKEKENTQKEQPSIKDILNGNVTVKDFHNQELGITAALALLGIPKCRDVSKESFQVLARYYQRKYHPDKGGDPNDSAVINKAVNIIKQTMRFNYE